MKIIIATDSFKGSLSSQEAARCMECGVRRIFADARIVCIPIADGGEGTVDAMVAASDGELRFAEVIGPDGKTVRAKYACLPDGSAVIEMAAASGLTLVSESERNVLIASTIGTGQLIRHALDGGCKKIYIGIGGSATNDGGAGMAQALGFRLLTETSEEVGAGGGALGTLARIDGAEADPRLAQAEITVICDVDNPLCGPQGASAVYGPQKGATQEQIALLDRNLAHFAQVVGEWRGADVSRVAGSGAAGGLGFGLLTFAGAVLRPGIEVLLDAARFDDHAKQADLVLTGEGRIDAQSARGKVPCGVAARALRFGLPVIAIAGSLSQGAQELYDCGIDAMQSAVCAPMSVEAAMTNAKEYLADAAERAMRAVRVGMRLGE